MKGPGDQDVFLQGLRDVPMGLEMPLGGLIWRHPDGNCFSVAVRRPIKDMSCRTEQLVLSSRELILEFRASHLSGVGLTTP